MFKRLLLQASLLLTLLLGVAAPMTAFAVDPFERVPCGSAGDSTVCQTKGAGGADPVTGPNGVIITATNIFAAVAGVAAVIFLILSGIKYVTSAGAPDQISKAKEGIIFALVGLLIIVLARAIIGLVLTRF